MYNNSDQLSQRLSVFVFFKILQEQLYKPQLFQGEEWEWLVQIKTRSGCYSQGSAEYPLFHECVCAIPLFIPLYPPRLSPSPTVNTSWTGLFLWKSGWIQFTLLQIMTSSSYSLPLLPAFLLHLAQDLSPLLLFIPLLCLLSPFFLLFLLPLIDK